MKDIKEGEKKKKKKEDEKSRNERKGRWRKNSIGKKEQFIVGEQWDCYPVLFSTGARPPFEAVTLVLLGSSQKVQDKIELN